MLKRQRTGEHIEELRRMLVPMALLRCPGRHALLNHAETYAAVQVPAITGVRSSADTLDWPGVVLCVGDRDGLGTIHTLPELLGCSSACEHTAGQQMMGFLHTTDARLDERSYPPAGAGGAANRSPWLGGCEMTRKRTSCWPRLKTW